MSRETIHAIIRRPYFAVVLAVVVSVAAIGSAYPFTAERLGALTRETGWIEVTTAALYLIATLALLASWRRDGRFFVHSAVLVALLGARELDLHKAFTSDSILSTRFFFRDQAGLQEKILAGLFLLAMAVVVLRYLRNWPRLRDGLRRRSPAAISAALAILLLPATKSLDAFGRVAKGFGFEITFDINAVGIVEESVELAIPAVIILATAQFLLGAGAAPRPP